MFLIISLFSFSTAHLPYIIKDDSTEVDFRKINQWTTNPGSMEKLS